MLKKERFGLSIWIGLFWVLVGWLIYISTYAGFGAGLLALPLSIGYWVSQHIIMPLSTSVANYLNAFVLSVPAGILASLLIEKVLSTIVRVCRSRIVYLRPKTKRRMLFMRKKTPITALLWKRPKDVEN